MVRRFKQTAATFKANPIDALRSLILATDKELNTKSHLEVSVSGTTACVVYFDFETIYVANVGDSRAVLAKECQPSMLKDQ
jgi:serine/threonine protein phosphatase PrpC